MPREEIDLDPGEIRAFLAAARTAVLVTAGTSHPLGEVVTVELAAGDEELVVVPTPAALAAVAADPRVCVIVEEQPDFAGIRGVLVHGDAAPVDGGRLAVPLTDVVSFDFGRLRVNRAPG